MGLAEGVEKVEFGVHGSHRRTGIVLHRLQRAVEIAEICRSIDRQSAQHGYRYAVPRPVAALLCIHGRALESLEGPRLSGLAGREGDHIRVSVGVDTVCRDFGIARMRADHQDPLMVKIHIVLQIVQSDGRIAYLEVVTCQPKRRFAIAEGLAQVDVAQAASASLKRLPPSPARRFYLDVRFEPVTE